MTAQSPAAPVLRIAQPLTKSHAQPDDTLALRRVLNRLGLFVPDRRLGMNAYAGTDLFDALDRFRRNNGLPTGAPLRPDDPAIGVLNAALAAWPGGRRYVWRTVGDDRVRPAHAALEGRSFTWAAPPAEGHPGTAPGCRCWAEPVGPVCHTGPWLKEALDLVERNEGFVPHPYGDTKGKITTGFGFNVNALSDFQGMPFRIGAEDGPLATEAEKAAGFEAMEKAVAAAWKAAGQGAKKLKWEAGDYIDYTLLRLSRGDALKIVRQKIERFHHDLRQKFADFDCLPTPAKSALMDLIYNIGATKFSALEWPNLFQAVRDRDWERAAAESNRFEVQPERNERTKTEFLKALSIDGLSEP